ncbi:MAG: hypothetical protein JSW58_08510 [Candidatus Latescibacterota bacterium]|nr:MAG: hypothetical protein JSW58_08510 [Candidatus Latescibacterota bacterium]
MSNAIRVVNESTGKRFFVTSLLKAQAYRDKHEGELVAFYSVNHSDASQEVLLGESAARFNEREERKERAKKRYPVRRKDGRIVNVTIPEDERN